MKIRNLFLSFLLIPNFNFIQTRAEDLSEDFKSQLDCSWENASYRNVTNSGLGDETRFCVDKKSNIYQILEGNKTKPNWTGITISNLGPIRLGNLKKQEVTEGNSCILGTNIQCLTNVIYTTTQYKVEGNYLMKYWRTEMNGNKDRVNSSIVGININAKNELLKKAISLNKLAFEELKNRNFVKAGYYAARGSKWIDNQISLFLIAQSQVNSADKSNWKRLYENALGFIEALIREKSSMEYGYEKKILDDGEYYHARVIIKSRLQIDPESYCKDMNKAIELSPENKNYKKRYSALNCN